MDSWKIFSCFILVSMALVFANYESVVAEREGIPQVFSRQLYSGSGLREFLPKAGSIVKTEGTRDYAAGGVDRLTRTSHLEWRREKDRKYLVRTYKAEEKTRLGLQFIEATTVYEVTSGHIAIVSGHLTSRGVVGQFKSRATYDPPKILLQWPLRKGDKWEQSILVTSERDAKNRMVRHNISSVVSGEETIHTPAGKFHTWRIEHTEENLTEIAWWAKGRWIVKWELHTPRYVYSLELVEFKEPER